MIIFLFVYIYLSISFQYDTNIETVKIILYEIFSTD